MFLYKECQSPCSIRCLLIRSAKHFIVCGYMINCWTLITHQYCVLSIPKCHPTSGSMAAALGRKNVGESWCMFIPFCFEFPDVLEGRRCPSIEARRDWGADIIVCKKCKEWDSPANRYFYPNQSGTMESRWMRCRNRFGDNTSLGLWIFIDWL